MKGKPRDLPIPMFDGQIAGITLAALPLKSGFSATLPMLIPNMGSYWLKVNVVGCQAIIVSNGLTVDTWVVNTDWLNLTDGTLYSSGRGETGGVYYIAVNPVEGIPPVIEYANNGGLITWDGVRRDKQ